MAIYVFRCPRHGSIEVERNIRDDLPDTIDCPEEVPDDLYPESTILCGEKATRELTAPNIIIR